MPLSTNPSFSQVRAFFNGPANLSAYVRGGAYVPDIPANNAISTTAAGLRLSQFSGADNVVPTNPVYLSASPNPASDSDSAEEKFGDMMAVTTLSPSGGNGTYSYSTVVVSTTARINASSVVVSFVGNVMRCACRIGAVSQGQTVTGTVVVDVTVTSGTSTATHRQTYNYTWRWISPK